MKKGVAFFLFTICAFSIRAQFFDSLQTSLNRGGSFTFMFNSRHSSITNHDAYVFSLLFGVRFDKKIGLGGGFNVLAPAVRDSIPLEGKNIARYLYLNYMSYYIEYLIKLTKHWEIDIFFMPGLGTAFYSYTTPEGQAITADKQWVIPLEPSACIEYDFTKWIGFYVQGGYRWMLITNNQIHENFNSPTYALGLAIYPLEIYAALFPRTKLAHLIED